MLKYVVAALVLSTLLATPAAADLHYTMHTEIHQVPTTEPANPMLAMGADIMVKTMLPEGATDSIFWVSDKGLGTRVELTKASAMMPAGSVVLSLPDGTTIVMNPKDKTYWKLATAGAMPQMMSRLAEMKPEVAFVHTGEFATIAGVNGERVTSSITINLPTPPAGTPVPPGMPTSVTIQSDLWMADQYAYYGEAARGPATPLGLMTQTPPGFVLKTVMRNSMMPAIEIESTVTQIAEEPAAANAFEIPADYTEVASGFSMPAAAPRPGPQ